MRKTLFFLSLCFTIHINSYAQKGTVAEYVEQGVALHDKGDYKAALEKYEQALKLDNNSSTVHYEMATSYLSMKDYKQSLKHIDIVLKNGHGLMDQAYMLKGNLLDMQGKSKEAIEIYEMAIKNYPGNHLMYYNLALALVNSKGPFDKITDALEHALQLKPDHASSHVLLGYTMIAEGKKVQAVLALYNFLLLEPASARSEGALSLLLEQMQSGVKRKEDKSISITLNADDESDEFRAAGLALSMMGAYDLGEDKDKPELERFMDNTKRFFSIMTELKKDHKDFWWNFYVDFFGAMNKAGHTETFCHYIWQTKNNVKANQWLKSNPEKIKKFSDWYDHYKR